jgi:hypothetical protein
MTLVGAVAGAVATVGIRLALAAASSDWKMPYYIHKLADDTTEDSTVRGGGGRGANLFMGRKGRDFWEILSERVGGCYFLARKREEMV